MQDPNRAIGALQKKVKDNISTTNARVAEAARPPTGMVQIWLGSPSTPPDGALLLDGRTLNRADYARLWQWAQDNGGAGTWFGNGNGTTTFVLPNFASKQLQPVGGSGTTYYANYIVWT